MGIEPGDWTIREVQAAKVTVQLLWKNQYRVALGNDIPSRDHILAEGNGEPGRLGLVEEEEEHHRRWQAKRRRITPGNYYHLYAHIKIPNIAFLIQLTSEL